MGVTNKIEPSFAGLGEAERQAEEAEDFAPFNDEPEAYEPWEDGESPSSSGDLWPKIATVFLLTLGFIWAAVFVLSRNIVAGVPIPTEVLSYWVGEISAFTLPLILIGIALLFVRRGSAAEARRFQNTAAQLASVEEKLAGTLSVATHTLATNRDELHEVTLQLADLGQQASQQLQASAVHIQTAFDSSSKAAEQMQSVTNAAVSNLDRLRGQVPVLTNSAKDLTNAIAQAGGGAAAQVRDLSLMLTRISEQNTTIAGDGAALRKDMEQQLGAMAEQMAALNKDFSHQLQARRSEAEALFGAIGSQMDENGARLIAHLAEADVRVSALMQEAQSSARNLAKLVANNTQIASHHSQQILVDVDETVVELGRKIDVMLSQTSEKSTAQLNDIAKHMVELDAALTDNMAKVAQQQNGHIDAMSAAITATNTSLRECGTGLNTLTQEQQSELQNYLTSLNEAVAQIAGIRAQEAHELQKMLGALNTHVDDASNRIAELSDAGTQQTAKLAFAFETSSHTFTQLSELMRDSEGKVEALLAMNDQLRHTITQTADAINETLPANLNRFGERLGDVKEAIAEQSSLTRDLENQGERLVVQFRKLDRLIAEQTAAMERLNASGTKGMQERLTDAKALAALLADIRGNLAALDSDQADEITALTDALKAKVDQDIADLNSKIEALPLASQFEANLGAVDIDAMAAQQADALSAALRKRLQSVEEEHLAIIDRLEARYLRLSEMTEALEYKADESEGQFGTLDEEGFARRMALLTESLNSAAIDVAKILSNEVTDTAWEQYLKGDRGVFTRRAVRLLNTQEVRIIARHYHDDREFRAQVNRYIHDFEAMMRVLLSTRDGHVVSVTLLSSDVGKLYVALAQAIERLRQ